MSFCKRHEQILIIIFHERVVWYLTDDASYMVKSREDLKVFYPKLIYIMCMAYIAEVIRKKYKNIDRLILYTKNIFLKAPSH